MIVLKFCEKCGEKFENNVPAFCGVCGSKTNQETANISSVETVVETDNKNQPKEDGATNDESKVTMVNKYQFEKGVVLGADALNALRHQKTNYFQPISRQNNTTTLVALCIFVLIIIAGGYFYWQHWQFNQLLDDYKYQFKGQWELLLSNSQYFKDKCDNVYNKPVKDMSTTDKLHNYKTEAVNYRSSLESCKKTLDMLKMDTKLKEFNNLGVFMDDLLVAINTNIDYCDNIINLCGDPVNAKKEAQNKGQDVENAYIKIYRNNVFQDYFSDSMRIKDLDSIGGMIEGTAKERIKEMEKPITNNAVVININGDNVNTGGGNTNAYVQPVVSNPNNSVYHKQMYNLLKKIVSVRVEFGKIPAKYRAGEIDKLTFKTLCQNAGKQRDNLLIEMQSISGVPAAEADRHQAVMQCLIVGSAACYDIATKLADGGDWELVLEKISNYNNQNLDPILDYYQIY